MSKIFNNDFHDLFTRYANDIYRFALFLCGDKTEAEDITAETFSRVLTGKTPIVTATVKGYLLTIARNLYLESVRRQNRLTEFPTELPDSSAHLENIVSHKSDLEIVQTYLRTFPEIDRSALLLRADGMSYSEIAVSLNISLSSAKVKVHRLRLKLVEWRTNREKTKT
ncbi:MAG: RNA polymerase sigma factor [Melioribacteraceae bacterium]|nr:RNA polymerase sigma factor [Melioribacteraceae bacterium]MCF8263688.1 RNA polymerase sigma factor [Melioribacteraceae bacterium]MCF8431065.1 RNA polymerase sigma factor [Melioribacteraceae bacterium]